MELKEFISQALADIVQGVLARPTDIRYKWEVH